MSELKKRYEKIESIKNGLYDHNRKFDELIAEIEQHEKDISVKQSEYEKLVLANENDKADKLYLEIEKIKGQFKSKKKRFDTLQNVTKTHVLEKWNEIKETTNGIHQLHYQEYEDKINEYLELKYKADNIKLELMNIGNRAYGYGHNLSIEGNNTIKDHGHKLPLWSIVIHNPFTQDYFINMEKQYREKQNQ